MSAREKLNDWTVQGDSAANTAVNINKAASPGQRHYITGFEVVVRAAAGAAGDYRIMIRSATTIRWDTYLTTPARGAVLQREFARPILCGVNEAAQLDVPALGAGAIATVNLKGYTLG